MFILSENRSGFIQYILEYSIFAVVKSSAMNKKDIIDISLSEVVKRIGDNNCFTSYEGCFISSHYKLTPSSPILFEYPCRLNALSVFICEKGRIKFTANLKQHTLTDNMIYIGAPHNLIEVLVEEESIIHAIAIEQKFLQLIDGELRRLIPIFPDALEKSSTPIPLQPEEVTNFCDLFVRIKNEIITIDNNSPYKKEILHSYGSVVLYKVCNILHRELQRNKTNVAPANRSRNEEYFRSFMQEVLQHFHEERSLKFYASKLHITPKYLTTIIKQVSNKTASEWIDDCVITEAKNLLKYTDLSIQQVAYRLNFSNQSFFGTYFRRRTGISPSEYKQS